MADKTQEIRAGDVDVIQYFPPHISKITEFQQIADTYDEELKLTWEQIGIALANMFISTANSQGLSYFEGLLGITPSPGETLEERRAEALRLWRIRQSIYTFPVFLRMVKDLYGNVQFNKFFIENNRLYVKNIGPNDFVVDNNRYYANAENGHGIVIISENFDVGYTMNFDIVANDFTLTEQLRNLFDTVTPANLVPKYHSWIYCIEGTTEYFGGAVSCCMGVMQKGGCGGDVELHQYTGGAVTASQIYYFTAAS